jgi:hypothetical protein
LPEGEQIWIWVCISLASQQDQVSSYMVQRGAR